MRTSTRNRPASSAARTASYAPNCVVRRFPEELEPEADPATAGSIGIARVLERDRQERSRALGRNPDRAPLDELRDAVHDRVLDERLQEQGRDEARVGLRIGFADDPQAGPQTHLLDGQKAIGQRRTRPPARCGWPRPAGASLAGSPRAAGTFACALAGSAEVSALIECRLLKMKCGSICARTARSSASRASKLSSSARLSASRDASNAMSR